MKYVVWSSGWNRPLSKEEREIAKRLDRAPKDSGLGELVQSIEPRLSDQRFVGGAEERRGEDAEERPERTWITGQCGFVDGDG